MPLFQTGDVSRRTAQLARRRSPRTPSPLSKAAMHSGDQDGPRTPSPTLEKGARARRLHVSMQRIGARGIRFYSHNAARLRAKANPPSPLFQRGNAFRRSGRPANSIAHFGKGGARPASVCFDSNNWSAGDSLLFARRCALEGKSESLLAPLFQRGERIPAIGMARELHRPLWKRGRAPGVGMFRCEQSERGGFAFLFARRGAPRRTRCAEGKSESTLSPFSKGGNGTATASCRAPQSTWQSALRTCSTK
jgi:hypothetical protein